MSLTDVVGSLWRGVAAGSVAGVGFGAYVALVANPLVVALERFEPAASVGAEAGPVVAGPTAAATSVAGGVLWGVLLGAAFGVAFYVVEPALPEDPVVAAYVLAGAGLLTASVTPWLVLPPAVPGAVSPVPTPVRLGVYVGFMALGGALAIGTVVGYRRLARRHASASAGAVAVGALLAVLSVLWAVTPNLSDPSTAPAALGAAFLGVVVFGQVGLWFGLATAFGWLHRRAAGPPGTDGPGPRRSTD